MKNFAITGVAGFVAPRHLTAINNTGNRLVAAADPHDSVGILDKYFPDARFFTEVELFERFLEQFQHNAASPDTRLHYLSICSPNYLHDAHVRLALRLRADAICEKPLVLRVRDLAALEELERETGNRVYVIMQLRLHPVLQALKQRVQQEPTVGRFNVSLTYIARRGTWYQTSWKSSDEKSGGIAMHIGIHYFDLLLWLFGPLQQYIVHVSEPQRLAGILELERAHVRFFLSLDAFDLPKVYRDQHRHTLRSLQVNGEDIDLAETSDLHTKAYEEILEGRGLRIQDARPSIELVDIIRSNPSISSDKPDQYIDA